MPTVRVRSYQRHGRLVPREAKGLRAGAVVLRPGEMMAWHSTRDREELLVALSGQLQLEYCGSRTASPHACRRSLRAGQCAFLPRVTLHRVVNRSRTLAAYLYITAPVPDRLR